MDFAEGGEGEEAREGRGGERRGGETIAAPQHRRSLLRLAASGRDAGHGDCGGASAVFQRPLLDWDVNPLRKEVEKKKGDTFSSHSSGTEKLKLRMAQVQPIWTKYFELEPTAEEEDSVSGEEDSESEEDNAQLDDINEEVHGLASC